MEKANKGNEILRRISFDISKDQTNQALNLVEILGKYENVSLSCILINLELPCYRFHQKPFDAIVASMEDSWFEYLMVA